MSKIHSGFPKDERQNRILWIDYARGFTVFIMGVSAFLPTSVRDVGRFFLNHPKSAATAQSMNFYDLGLATFIFLMGLVLPLSFQKRTKRDGTRKALTHMTYRYGILILLGILLGEAAPITVGNHTLVAWGTFMTLGTVGFIGLLLLYIPWPIRIALGVAGLCFYQYMLLFGDFQRVALMSYSGGLYGSIFGYSFVMIVATSIAPIFDSRCEQSVARSFRLLGSLCFFFLFVAFILVFDYQVYPNHQQVTSSYIFTCLGVICGGSLLFVLLSIHLKRPIPIVSAFGKNSLLVFVIMFLGARWFHLLELHPSLNLRLVLPALMIVTVLYLDRKGLVAKL